MEPIWRKEKPSRIVSSQPSATIPAPLLQPQQRTEAAATKGTASPLRITSPQPGPVQGRELLDPSGWQPNPVELLANNCHSQWLLAPSHGLSLTEWGGCRDIGPFRGSWSSCHQGHI